MYSYTLSGRDFLDDQRPKQGTQTVPVTAHTLEHQPLTVRIAEGQPVNGETRQYIAAHPLHIQPAKRAHLAAIQHRSHKGTAGTVGEQAKRDKAGEHNSAQSQRPAAQPAMFQKIADPLHQKACPMLK